MTMLKFVTGLFAILLITVIPIVLKAEDICEESTDRVEYYLTEFVEEAAQTRHVSKEMVERLFTAVACEPDIYEIGITLGIRRLVPGGGEYCVNMSTLRLTDRLSEIKDTELDEGDTVTVSARVVSPSLFSRLTRRYDTAREGVEGSICMGRRIGWGMKDEND